IRAERQELTDRIKSSDFSKLEGKSYPDVAIALGQIGDAAAIRPIAEKISQARGCVPSTISSAAGFKLEELFPETAAIELSKTMYKKSSDCGRDYAAGQAAFRLGLISVWQNKCADVDPLMKKVESIPEASQFHARAKYWRYHCAGVAKNEKGRGEMREALVSQHPMSFQNLAVNGGDDAMMSRVMRADVPQTVLLRSVVRPDLNDVIRSAEALERLGETTLAGEFIDRSVSDLNTIEPEARLYVAAMLDRMKITLTKFKIMSPLFQDAPRLVSKSTMLMLFPLQFAEIVRNQAKDIDPLLILSLMRQESAFNASAVSLVGARGLMQVMPATARSIASVRAARLFDPTTNVGVGTKYLQKRLMQYNGDVELTLAAYNAGAGRVDRWMKRYTTDNKVLFLDFIPFKETREYVSSILRNYYWYVRLYNAEAMKAAMESKKVQIATDVVKVQAIMAANAGLVAWQAPAPE
ncbi:MAG: lytic transglycosylase domain-containing protein, partial [Bdellovibrionota bacterium]